MNFIVTSGVWKTGTPALAAASRNSRSGRSPRLKMKQGILNSNSAVQCFSRSAHESERR